ncbi:hypothetical protein F8O06_00705 [Pseudoclavibacter sp. CFCC 14310]|uniref:hypothetical protein n=1 Tax=Pseudoclavibacter sp. CFCC 14310 TaxID=2615180 RepID=UPI00130117D6|nr:hypothetical protein [Pseudoclavibacter sp. CFCC 14310]KAB1647135.1 hypothetical protein F8O06_00705 [Pseudoclavibacter sp. CFCC 14310]
MPELRGVYAEQSTWRDPDGSTRPIIRIYCAGRFLTAIEPDHAYRLSDQLVDTAETINGHHDTEGNTHD